MPTGEDTPDYGPNRQALERFLARLERLTDDDRVVVAEARAAVAEDFHTDVLAAACDPLLERAEAYVRARRRVVGVHLPEALAKAPFDDTETRARWSDVSRLVQLAVEEGLILFVSGDLLHPNHVRELGRPWSALDARLRAEP